MNSGLSKGKLMPSLSESTGKDASLIITLAIASLFLLLGCTSVDVVDLNETSEQAVDTDMFNPGAASADGNASGTAEVPPVEQTPGQLSGSGTEGPEAGVSGEGSGAEGSIVNGSTAEGNVVEGNGRIPQELCPEQVLLAIKGCKRYNGNLNISLMNQLSDVSMIFYYIYDGQILSEEHSSEIVPSKEVRSYIINLESVEQQYGEVRKIEATPVYTREDGTMIACSNKKLPIIVKYSCN